jgi:SAM-dependent methyltransferase
MQPVMLEIGCSSGFLLGQLCKQFPQACVIGADVIKNALHNVANNIPNIPLLCFDLVHCPLPDNCCDVVILLNVLEHIENDTAAMRQICRILKPGGIAVLEVPAGAQLFDSYDAALLHFRRYSLAGLRNLVKLQGMHILSSSHLGCFLYPGFWLIKRFCEEKFVEIGVKQKEKVARHIKKTGNSKLYGLIMQIELMLGKYISYPFGIRCVMTCMKPKK